MVFGVQSSATNNLLVYAPSLLYLFVLAKASLYDYIAQTNKDKAMARKRAPGGGRKPQGEFTGKTASLTTRIRPRVREGLEREAQRNGRSLSQEVERRLTDSLEMPQRIERGWGPPHVQALARLVARAVRTIEGSTGRRWRDDAFTGQAARAAINILMEHLVLVPDGALEIPEEVERSAQATARILPDRLEFYRHPEGVASAVALGLLSQLEAHEEPPPLNHPKDEHYSDAYYLMPRLRKDLGFKSKKEEGQ
jgi:hypothetical protein